MSRIKGITVKLIEKSVAEIDPFGNEVFTEMEVDVENVLVSPSSQDDIVTSTNLYGKKAVYTLAIPKGDTHTWVDTKVKFFDKTWRTFGEPVKGIDELIPLDWNMKVMVELYE